MFVLNAEKRNLDSKVKQLRRKGIIPGVLYGKDLDESLCIQIPQKDAARFLRSNSTGSQVELVIDKDKIPALLREVSYKPVVNELEHLSFQTLIAGEIITNTAPIVIVNKDKVVGTIEQSLSEVSYRASTADLVEKVEVDLDGAQIGDIIRISDLDIAKNENIEILTPLDATVVGIEDIRKPEEPTPEAVEEETETA